MLRRLTTCAELQPAVAFLEAASGVHGKNLCIKILARGEVRPAWNPGIVAGNMRSHSLSHRQQLRRQQPVRLRVK